MTRQYAIAVCLVHGVAATWACGSGKNLPNQPRDDAGVATQDAPSGTPDPDVGPIDIAWIHGSPSCEKNTDPPIQVFSLNADTFILRQNKCIHYEAPFIYLLFGDQRVFMQDTGATASAEQFPLQATVQGVIDDWLKQRGQSSIELVITHSHGHGDHVAGDGQFAGMPNARIVAATATAVQSFFGITSWPEQIVSYDLGNRVLDVIPIPGHHAAHVAIYDRTTGILLTGDTLYPGRLYINDFTAYAASIARLVEFASTRNVTHVLGTHIEMSRTPGVDYPIGATYQPDEHPLELSRTHLQELDAALRAMGQTPVREAHDSFIIYPQ